MSEPGIQETSEVSDSWQQVVQAVVPQAHWEQQLRQQRVAGNSVGVLDLFDESHRGTGVAVTMRRDGAHPVQTRCSHAKSVKLEKNAPCKLSREQQGEKHVQKNGDEDVKGLRGLPAATADRRSAAQPVRWGPESDLERCRAH